MPGNDTKCFVTTINLSLASKLKGDLEEQGFELKKPVYTVFQAKKKGVSLTLYESGKLMVQGKNKHEFITYYLEPEILQDLAYSYPEKNVEMHERIGVDEAGKGDYFGPLCIGGLYVNGEEDITKLLKMGVKDSKRINDDKILKLAKEIKKSFKYSVVRIFPKRYNEMYNTFHNLNQMLAWGHASAIEKLVEDTGCSSAIIDQFASEHVVEKALSRKSVEINLVQRHKGEEDPVVAGASILARASFVEGLDELKEQFALKLPKGASAQVIDAAKIAVIKHGETILQDVAKLHFKTTEQVLIG
ncbi:ribonuclease HIII [Candidatus Aerophobetes bacterium]|uniref:Ribonuclease HIII n=1 Tax=Aerophobetes bacterium TaxID=2030807 RepID=A0A2A4YMS7_UNCAE|nr:MAG: ribonuclease HIII [Candidatus Aerophobetes bacterium]